jgi:Tfp pilus assembly protein PilN
MQVQAEEHAEALAAAHTTIQELQENKQQQSHAIDTLRKKLAGELCCAVLGQQN